MAQTHQARGAGHSNRYRCITRPCPDGFCLNVMDAAQVKVLIGEFQLVQGFDESDLSTALRVLLQWFVEEPREGFDEVGSQFGEEPLADQLRGIGYHEVGGIAEGGCQFLDKLR